MRERRQLADEARQRASSYAPLPRHEPLNAGLIGAALCAVIVSILTGLAGFDLERFAVVFAAITAIGFILPFAYFWNEKRLHYDAWSKEHDKLKKERDA